MDADGLIAHLVNLLCVTVWLVDNISVEHICLQLMTPNATGIFVALDMAGRVYWLADGGCAARLLLMAPARISRNRRQRQASQTLRSIRILIELSIGVNKFHAYINSTFMHKRCHLLFVGVGICQTGECSSSAGWLRYLKGETCEFFGTVGLLTPRIPWFSVNEPIE